MDPAEAGEVLALVQGSFAYMDGVIAPPSSMHRLTGADVAGHQGEVWVIGHPVQACVFLTVKPDALYVGKLAVDPAARGQGLARALVDKAEERAMALGLGALELQVRVELTGNQAAFSAMGFAEVVRTAHPGFDRATSITYRRTVQRGGSA